MKQLALVLGPPRSGTSAACEHLVRLGYRPPLDRTVLAYDTYESDAVIRLLGRNADDAGWADELLVALESFPSPGVLKLTALGAMDVVARLHVRGLLRFVMAVIVHRDPKDVLASQHKYDPDGSPTPGIVLDRWTSIAAQCMDEAGIPFTIVEFDDVVR